MLPDIENLIVNSDDENYRNNISDVIVTRLKKREPEDIQIEAESFVPGTHHIYIQTWGCSHNSSDSEYMAGILASYGFKVSLNGSCQKKENEEVVIHKKQSSKSPDEENKLKADLWILNSCTVKNPAEDHFRNMIAEARKYNKKVIVSGCVPQGQPKAPYLKGVSMIGVQQIDRVIEVVEETLKGNSVQFMQQKREKGRKLGGARLDLPKIRRNPLIEILPINTGCLNACTYCKTKHARGQLGSYPVEEILERCELAFKDGCVELWLTSEDLGAYGRDIGTDLASLLEALVERVPPGCMVRLGMTNPPHILGQLDRIAAILRHPRVYAFLHVPVQSGSDNVLGEMRREYTRDDFCKVVDTLRAEVGGAGELTVATDVICGFPTETDDDFEDTVRLVDQYRFPVLFTNQFYPRQGTPAARMPRVASSSQVKTRTKRIHELFHSYEPYTGREGTEAVVLVTEESTDQLHFVGHTKAYEQVLLPRDPEIMGRTVRVRVTATSKHSMKAEVLELLPYPPAPSQRESHSAATPKASIATTGVQQPEQRQVASVTRRSTGLLDATMASRLCAGLLLALITMKIYSVLVGSLTTV